MFREIAAAAIDALIFVAQVAFTAATLWAFVAGAGYLQLVLGAAL